MPQLGGRVTAMIAADDERVLGWFWMFGAIISLEVGCRWGFSVQLQAVGDWEFLLT